MPFIVLLQHPAVLTRSVNLLYWRATQLATANQVSSLTHTFPYKDSSTSVILIIK